MKEPEIIKFLGPDTYKDKLLSLQAKRMVFTLYHIMKLRNGDIYPEISIINSYASEHGILNMNLEDMICHERWLREGKL